MPLRILFTLAASLYSMSFIYMAVCCLCDRTSFSTLCITVALGFPGRPSAVRRCVAVVSSDDVPLIDGGLCLEGRMLVFTEFFLGRIDIRGSRLCWCSSGGDGGIGGIKGLSNAGFGRTAWDRDHVCGGEGACGSDVTWIGEEISDGVEFFGGDGICGGERIWGG